MVRSGLEGGQLLRPLTPCVVGEVGVWEMREEGDGGVDRAISFGVRNIESIKAGRNSVSTGATTSPEESVKWLRDLPERVGVEKRIPGLPGCFTQRVFVIGISSVVSAFNKVEVA